METKTINGATLALVDRGAGPVVVLVHGFPLDHTMWDAQVEAISKHHRVLAVDLRGFGRSEATDAAATMEQFADDVAGLLDAFGVREPIVLGGLSMGGYVCFAFWRKYAARLRALILCDTRAEADSPEAAAARRAAALRVLESGPGVLIDGMASKLFAEATPRDRPELVEALGRMVEGCDARGVAAAALGMASRPDSTPILGRVRCPTLVVVGQEDAVTPPDATRRMAAAIPGARLVVIPGAGHLSPMEQPSRINAAFEAFLAEL